MGWCCPVVMKAIWVAGEHARCEMYMGMSQNRGAYYGCPKLIFLVKKKKFSGTPIVRHSHMNM